MQESKINITLPFGRVGWGTVNVSNVRQLRKYSNYKILEIRSTLGCMHWVLSCYIYVYYLLSTKSGKGTFSRIGSVKFTSKLQTENLSTSYLIHAGALFTSREGCVRLSVLCVVSRSSLMDLHLTFKQDLDRKRSGVLRQWNVWNCHDTVGCAWRSETIDRNY